jgi:hypothetical protein
VIHLDNPPRRVSGLIHADDQVALDRLKKRLACGVVEFRRRDLRDDVRELTMLIGQEGSAGKRVWHTEAFRLEGLGATPAGIFERMHGSGEPTHLCGRFGIVHRPDRERRIRARDRRRVPHSREPPAHRRRLLELLKESVRGRVKEFQADVMAAADRVLFGDLSGAYRETIEHRHATGAIRGSCPRCGAPLILIIGEAKPYFVIDEEA